MDDVGYNRRAIDIGEVMIAARHGSMLRDRL